MNYYLSGALLDRQGLIRYGRDTFKRYNHRQDQYRYYSHNISYTNRWTREEYSCPSYMTASLLPHTLTLTDQPRVRDVTTIYPLEMRPYRCVMADRPNCADRINQQLVLEARPMEGLLLRAEEQL